PCFLSVIYGRENSVYRLQSAYTFKVEAAESCLQLPKLLFDSAHAEARGIDYPAVFPEEFSDGHPVEVVRFNPPDPLKLFGAVRGDVMQGGFETLLGKLFVHFMAPKLVMS